MIVGFFSFIRHQVMCQNVKILFSMVTLSIFIFTRSEVPHPFDTLPPEIRLTPSADNPLAPPHPRVSDPPGIPPVPYLLPTVYYLLRPERMHNPEPRTSNSFFWKTFM